MTHQLSSNFGEYDWPTQLKILKSYYGSENINVKYLDEENEEVGIYNQNDLDYAYQISLGTEEKKVNLIVRDQNGEILGKNQFHIDYNLKKNTSHETKDSSQTSNLSNSASNKAQLTTLNNIPTEILESKSQMQWLVGYLEKFKKDIIDEMKDMIKTQLEQSTKMSLNSTRMSDEFENIENDTSLSLKDRVQRLFSMLLNAKSNGRPLKVAYLEEELLNTSAFSAEFLRDCNMPDGTKCEPNVKFQKTWLLRNNGKLDWNESFPVKLYCIAGNIVATNGEYVSVSNTNLNETTSVSVELVAPALPGVYFSEWVLSCFGFHFGPRIWCTIEVIDSNSPTESQFNSGLNQKLTMRPHTLLETKLNQSSYPLIQNKSNQAYRYLSDDFDDEFVVVPDCFDLTKKWKPTSSRKDSFSTQSSINDEKNIEKIEKTVKTENEDLINLGNDLKAKEESESSKINVLDERINDTIKDEYEQFNSIVTIDANTNSIQTLIDTNETIDNSNQVKVNQQQDKSDLSAAFDLMKNALSNLRGPSYVGNVDLEFLEKSNPQPKEEEQPTVSQKETFPQQTPSNLIDRVKFNDESIIIAKQPESNMEKLISMGFANRFLNNKLLRKYNNNMELVIQALVDRLDNNWMESR